jgi:hypothetical protein
MTAALLNIPPGEAIQFAFTMALVIGFRGDRATV